MARLGEVIGAIMTQIDRGRSQADAAVLEVAQLYREHPLLRDFPVPRVTLDEVVIDLKVAVASSPAGHTRITPEAKTEALKLFDRLVTDLPENEPLLAQLREKQPQFGEVWKSAGPEQIMRTLGDLLPDDAEVDPKALALGVSAVISRQLTGVLVSEEAKVPVATVRTFVRQQLPEVENRLSSQIQEILVKTIQPVPPAPDRLDVLVTASELESIPPERITTVKLSLHEADREWTQIETPEGGTQDKLVPH